MIRVVYYLRLSKDDYKKKKSLESNSIENQREILDMFCSKNADKYVKVHEYVDDGKTGMNFNRPGFISMNNDAKNGEFDMILIKDFSRFGRVYNETVDHISNLTRKYHIDVFSVSENLSSLRNFRDFESKVRFLFNELYSQSISEKVRTSQLMKMEKGKFIGSFACYGYKKDPNDNNHLIVDSEAADIVKRVFSDYISGLGQQKIARNLNREGVLCPSAYKASKGYKYHNSNLLPETKSWTYSTIHKMLSQRMYVGDMVQGKQLKSKFAEMEEYIEKSKGEGIIVENQHEPIIDRNTFEIAQGLLKRNTRTLKFDNVSLFAGYIHCKDCGRALAKTTNRGVITYVCSSYKMYGKDICTRHAVKEKELEAFIVDSINSEIKKYQDDIKAAAKRKYNNRADSAKKQIESKRNRLEAQYKQAEKRYKNNMDIFDPEYMDVRLYKEQMQEYKRIMVSAKQQLSELNENVGQQKPSVFDLPMIKRLDRAVLERFVKDIVVSVNSETGEAVCEVEWNY